MSPEAVAFVACVVASFVSLGITLAYGQWASGPGQHRRRKHPSKTVRRPAAWRGERHAANV
jgi:hypothetical protein